jgi:hypothetical protein
MRSRLEASRSRSSNSVLSRSWGRTNSQSRNERRLATPRSRVRPEGGIHLDNHSLRVAARHGHGSVLENGTESRPGVSSPGITGHGSGVAVFITSTLARDHSRKKARNGGPIPWCSRNGSDCPKLAVSSRSVPR